MDGGFKERVQCLQEGFRACVGGRSRLRMLLPFPLHKTPLLCLSSFTRLFISSLLFISIDRRMTVICGETCTGGDRALVTTA
mmetsp:Transcript_31546/g.62395  ORF Transcript_31546/g.62395 Transcript_31546/m.62395 type:complete len:82 (+) Transcript_31546:1309-1554(+)